MPRGSSRQSRVARTPLGARIHELRGELTLRELADDLKIDFTYLSKIENGSDVPGEETLRKVAARFKVDPDELLALAGKVPPELAARARRERPMGRLLRRLPSLTQDQLRQIYDVAGVDDPDPEGE
jgi:transcriptional regulator with XRE-family HTH domain